MFWEVNLGNWCDLQSELKAQSAKLVVWDPPYNLGQSYEAYHDRRTLDEYVAWAHEIMKGVIRVLHPEGSLWLFINDGLVSEMDRLLRDDFSLWRRSWVIWHYTFGQNHRRNFTPSHTHLLYFTRDKTKWTFNEDTILQPSARQIKYRDKRANPKGRLPDNTWVLFPEMLPAAFDPVGDTWLQSRVCGTFHERKRSSPNQLPEALIERIILATSNPGDLVVDPMCGTGTVGVVCKRHGRSFWGVELGSVCACEAQKRVEAQIS